MLMKLALISFAIAVVAAVFGIGEFAPTLEPLARMVFMVSISFFIIATVAHAFRKRPLR